MSEPTNAERGGDSAPAMWSVMLLNDDQTPMDFVVHVLEEIFDMEHDDAVRLMLRIHNEGAGECGVFAEEEAEARVETARSLAREHQHPLQCVMERNPPA